MPRNTTISFSSEDAVIGTEAGVNGEEEDKQEVEVDGEGEGKLEAEEKGGGSRDGGNGGGGGVEVEVEVEGTLRLNLRFASIFFFKKSAIVGFRFIFLQDFTNRLSGMRMRISQCIFLIRL